VIFLGHHP